ncbi:MAG: HAMP domain-containing protein [Deltaproteobacteria bacterium]
MRPYKRTHFFINKKIQIKYILLTVSLLVLYTMILLAAIFAPYAMALFLDLPMSQKAEAAEMLLLLHKNIWPGIGLIIVMFGALSIFITHKLAGPVFVLERMARDITRGDLTVRTRLRKGDDLNDLAQDMNQMADNLESLLLNLDEEYRRLASYVSELETELESKNISQQAVTEIVKKIEADKDDIRKTLERYNYQGKSIN